MRSLDELREKPDGPTAREMMEAAEEARREIERTFPGGITVHGTRPEDPKEGDCFVQADRRIMVWTGGEWKQLAVTPPRAMGGPLTPTGRIPWGPPGPLSVPRGGVRFGPADMADTVRVPDDPDAEEPRYLEELLEILLCPECDMELSAQACSPTHAFMAENPMTHRLLAPLLERYQEQIRFTENQNCPICSVPRATGDCPHTDVRGDQVRVSRGTWDQMAAQLADANERLVALKDALDLATGMD